MILLLRCAMTGVCLPMVFELIPTAEHHGHRDRMHGHVQSLQSAESLILLGHFFEDASNHAPR